VSRFSVLIMVVIAIFAVAIYAGWSSYRNSPEGLLLYTPTVPCPAMQHSFSLVYVTCLVVASVIAALVAIVTLAASIMQRFSNAKGALRSASKLSALAVALFLFGSFLGLVFQAQLPLHAKPGCERNAP